MRYPYHGSHSWLSLFIVDCWRVHFPFFVFERALGSMSGGARRRAIVHFTLGCLCRCSWCILGGYFCELVS